MPTVIAIHAGLPRDYPPERPGEPPHRTGLVKSRVGGPVRVTRTGMEGDGQAVPEAHGGPDRAVLAYANAHYPVWQAEHAQFEFPVGTYGENLTIDGLDEHTVCIGDVYRVGGVGGVTLAVTMPRTPCLKLNWRTGIPVMLDRMRETARIGWLHRVIEDGSVEQGDAVELLERPCPEWTVMRVFRVVEAVKAHDASQIEEGRRVAALSQLGRGYRMRLEEILARF